ncbi:hypothetical protein SC206_09205 [Rouxiella sp. T17]|uniref:hypothetical protein n=1 Tax=Rouxiella sp. T17 TaxID=3085684 RepID=UPI002FC8B664
MNLILKILTQRKLPLDSKSKTESGPLGGLRRRAVSEAHAFDLEVELKNSFCNKKLNS